jgi:hypothetical protein
VYDTYAKNKSCILYKRRFHRQYPGVQVPATATILKLAKKICSAGSILDKNALDKISCYVKKSLTKLEPD